MKSSKKSLFLSAVVLGCIGLLLFFSIGRKALNLNKSADNSLKLEVHQLKEGWGYDIRHKGKIFIKQDNIPAIQRSIPFRSEADARKVGKFVIQKLKNHISPSVSIHELDSLNLNF
jgi:hypothetical protein